MATGVWLAGGRGSVAATSIAGAIAIRAGLADSTGCVTELPQLRSPALPALTELVFGGHDPATTPLGKKIEALATAGVLPVRLVTALADDLAAVEPEIRPVPAAPTQGEVAALIAEDIVAFRRRHGLDRVVVVNVSATEPAAAPHPGHADPEALRRALDEPGTVLPPSSLYAYAAFTAGCPYVDFTPSTGARLPALDALARHHGVPYAGHDGKTGETLVKSVLAPMFAMRNLRVRTWSGTNLLGGGDGANLAEPGPNAAKATSKQRVLRETLGYEPQGTTRIEYVDDIGDFKTAWDLVTFSGFLGTAMRMEFTWHGCDSALAAPLVLDLARLTSGAHRAGRVGPLTELAFFFKDPLGPVPEPTGPDPGGTEKPPGAADRRDRQRATGPVPHGLAEQWALLASFVRGLADA
jgi:myo-inositol-1-phosphate synthase